ncbi:hypothetical protein Q9L42_011030 [Methylomarinum sp. Ch1-1]|uniref:Secreted protein n=1 Tax=Methylomarinum roseum TaxID=3067653 RepID=A0AAU7NPL2_9GAMM|nr:hypothetical protein [Methylomarinum sp. Ch1-1]MDP4521182.1 hypothetical protein [Methylomarinum sp. Ch1-1]
MFKTNHFFTIVLSFLITNYAAANCSSPSVTGQSLIDALTGNTVCTSDSQEEHHSGGQLWDYKTGDTSDPVDPRKQIGSWGIAADQVTYNYDDGTNTSGPFTFSLHYNGGNSYSFCQGASEIVTATIISGVNVGCGF